MENGMFGQQAHGNSQSQFQGADGSFSGSNSDATSGSFEGPFGLKGQQAASHSSSFNRAPGGGAGGASASAGSGSGFGGAQSGSFGGGGGGAQSNANAATQQSYPGYDSYDGLPIFG